MTVRNLIQYRADVNVREGIESIVVPWWYRPWDERDSKFNVTFSLNWPDTAFDASTDLSMCAVSEARQVVDRVEALIGRLAPAAICDGCIADTLRLGGRHQASQRTRELARMRGYERSEDDCAICGDAKPDVG